MKRSTLFLARSNLCSYDTRNPGYTGLKMGMEACLLDVPSARQDCGCDNCFYGRDRLALEILKLLERQQRPQDQPLDK